MVEDIERHRRELYHAEREAFEEYRIFLKTTPVPYDEISAVEFTTQMNSLRAWLARAEAARELFDAENPEPANSHL